MADLEVCHTQGRGTFTVESRVAKSFGKKTGSNVLEEC